MKQTLFKVRALWHLVQRGQLLFVFDRLKNWVWSDIVSIGLERDLTIPFVAPDALIPLTIRPLKPEDVDKIFGEEGKAEAQKSGFLEYELIHREALLRNGMPTCYVALSVDDEPCFIQWLIGPDSNIAIANFFSGTFPKLGPTERLLEYAYTVPHYQRRRIMSAAMARVAEEAAKSGATRAITFVDSNNIPALKGCARAGFHPYVRRITFWRLFHRTIRFVPLGDQFLIPDAPLRAA